MNVTRKITINRREREVLDDFLICVMEIWIYLKKIWGV